jgi:hypothetical protein
MFNPNGLNVDQFESEIATPCQVGIMVEAVSDYVLPGDKEALTTQTAITQVREACFDLYGQGLAIPNIRCLLLETVAHVEELKSSLDVITPEDFLRGQS